MPYSKVIATEKCRQKSQKAPEPAFWSCLPFAACGLAGFKGIKNALEIRLQKSKTCILHRIWAVCCVFMSWSDEILRFSEEQNLRQNCIWWMQFLKNGYGKNMPHSKIIATKKCRQKSKRVQKLHSGAFTFCCLRAGRFQRHQKCCRNMASKV